MAKNRAQLLITAADQTKGAFDSVKRSLGNVGNALRSVNGLLGSLGAAVSVAGLGAMVKSSLSSADALAKLSQKVGITVESLSTMIPAAELSGASAEKFEGGVIRLSARMYEASIGIADAVRSFDKAGVAFANQDGTLRSTSDVLLELAERFASMPDSADKTAIAVRLFGRSGAELIPFLNQGREGITALTDEMEALGLQISTDTARKAEVFNDSMSKVRRAAGAVGNRVIETFLPSMNAMALAMVESGKQGGGLRKTLDGLLLSIKTMVLGVSALSSVFVGLGETIGASLAAAGQALTGNLSGAGQIMADLKKNLFAQLDELADFRDSLFNPPPLEVEVTAPAIKADPTLVRPESPVTADDGRTDSARLARIKNEADLELKLLKSALDTQTKDLEAALEDRLLSVREYHAKKTAIEIRAIEAEVARTQVLLDEQKRQAEAAADENTRLKATGQIRKAETELILLNRKRAQITKENARAMAKAERELADTLAGVREELAQLTGTATDEDRRAAIERGYRDLKARLLAEGDADGIALVDQLINVKAAQSNLSELESRWQTVSERMRQAEEAISIRQQAGLLTERQARLQIVQLQQRSAAEMERLLPLMRQAAEAIGPDAVNRVQAWNNELARTRLVTDELAPLWNRVGESFGTALNGMLNHTTTWRGALLGIFQQVSNAFMQELVIKPFQQWVAMQAKMMASSFGIGGGATGAAGTSLFSIPGFARGGLVTGPGTATSDSIVARLSAGEFVINASAVKRVGVDFLRSINGLSNGPRVKNHTLAFAAGGLVPEATPQPTAPSDQAGQAVRIVNVLDPDLAADYLNSSSGEKTILNILQRNAGAVRQVLKKTTGV